MKFKSYKKRNQGQAFPKIDRRFIWIGLGGFAWIMDIVFRWNPHFTELIYSRGVFAFLRYLMDYTIGLSPIPLMYIGIFGLLCWLTIKIHLFSKGHKHQKRRNKVASLFLSLISFLCGAYFFFQVLWGYNYHRLPIEQFLELPHIQAESEDIEKELRWSVLYTQEARALISNDTIALDIQWNSTNLEEKSREAVKQLLKKLDYMTPGEVGCQRIYPKGFLMRLGAIGIYLPYIAEGSVDAAVHPIIIPFTYTHEIAHGYGFGDEGTANVIAFLSCIHSGDPSLIYAGHLGYLRYVLSHYRQHFPDKYEAAIRQIPKGIINDLKAIQAAHRPFQPIFPILFDYIYHHYLTYQGVKEGRKSYGKLVTFVLALRKKQEEDRKFLPLLP